MSEHVFNRLGLKISAPAPYKAKMANNVKVKCLGIVNGVKMKVCKVEVKVDVYVMPTKGKGYPIILGRSWLIAMQARKYWGTGMLELSPHKGSGKKTKVVRYDMKTGKQGKMKFETSADEFSSSTYSTTIEEESTTSDESDSSREQVMGLILTEPNKVDPPDIPRVEESKLAKMLARDLTEEEKQAYWTMLEDFPRPFIEGYDQITGVTIMQHHIKLKEGIKPTVQRLRRLGVIQQHALLAEVRKLLNACFIYPVEDSEWVSPVVVTPKKNGKWRVFVDYKPLNATTKRDHFPLPFQDEILNEVAGYERYTVCDGYSGYFQIRIAEEDQKKTTFVTPWGCFAYKVMPFGLTNALVTFQCFVTHVFQPFFGKSIRVFIDDFCIYSSHALNMKKVHEGLSRLESMGGQLNIDKCHIGEAQVTLLGHVVSARGIEVDPGKIQALTTLISPTSAKELVSFIQKVRYLSRFIHLLSQVVLPLQQLTHSNTFSWSEENEQQFGEVKDILSSLPTIAPPKWEETFYVNPSVGGDSIGAILMQNDDSFMRPIYFISRVMTTAEKDYTAGEHMVMALMFTVGKFRPYLLPKKFVILTLEENFPLVLQHMDMSARISKWLVRLQGFEYRVQVENSTWASLAGLLTHRFGVPLEILLDRGPGFREDLVGELMKKLKIKRSHSTPYYFQCNGLVDKVNGMICKIITKQVVSKPKEWDKHLQAALWSYRTSFRTSLGYTPYHLVFGKEAILRIEVQLVTLRVLASGRETPKEQLQERILDLERLELDRTSAIEFYATQAERR
ncbi:hypothetical protein L7F22_041179 [Adiantum nelumboides]|nr:hypothetical protein [Adiantum nelumboides]